ncbi:hypothetical protein TNCV_4313221 [Trichonephila clavipes]|nr:hypothetical protein TNCV_4313221 [Trichonephila clavipes]
MAPWPRAPVIPQLVDRKTFRDNRWSRCRNCGGGDRGRVAIYRPFGELRRAKIVLSPVRCSRPTTGVPLAHATMNFVGLDLTASDSCTRAFDDGPRNFEPWSSDVDDI